MNIKADHSIANIHFTNSYSYGLEHCASEWYWIPAPFADYDIGTYCQAVDSHEDVRGFIFMH
ncbi:hypothetical protein [Paenibacillus eucommiae]|uniref:Uncharacterized protein n=1 Tax=Paenibacillus eucommiae TaxID=1355755 RepID=A0ABS4J886_9BACL|nr:hypothetical protein [Paenibacillus eucommiae]MBP1996064.1 hypothetical protein [Paenibacillus eucommiae]